jgi:hypothetical protein
MKRLRSSGVWPVAVLVATLSVSELAAQPSDEAIKRCLALDGDAARLRCFETITSRSQPASPSALAPIPPTLPPLSGSTAARSQPIGRWRLVRTAGPEDGKETVAVMRNADLSGSDIDFAGLMFRCAKSETEVLVVLVRPLPPRSSARVSVSGSTFKGQVLPPGAAILLPPGAATLARTWQSQKSVRIEVAAESQTIKGVVAMDGFDLAIRTLTANCSVS